MNSAVLLTELVVVREWFHETAPRVQHPEAITGYWKFMKHILCRLYAQTQESIREGLVKELNPDAMNRKSEKIHKCSIHLFVLADWMRQYNKYINRGVPSLLETFATGRKDGNFDPELSELLCQAWVAIAQFQDQLNSMDIKELKLLGGVASSRATAFSNRITRHLGGAPKPSYIIIYPDFLHTE
ncbi:uncharacterized protein F5147DRAFT_649059 [Suillus discolor]|uniref:Nuclear pore complex protein n=1 Tax=Suillus discolor TaxID=1912936 RepID=A0A9P7FHZ1_9AGAM|nr:uncharacterized protein F5147DRAFT_649059 [Suillus discolor]KAG2116585.1 hypothetical protein F5147DRAFT_649059 [Suillus discolor]